MADLPQPSHPPALSESLRRQWDAFGAWGYERHARWGGQTLTSSGSWARTAVFTLLALILFIVGLERHANLWDWLSGHRQSFFILQAIATLGLGLLCIWLLAYRPLTRRSAQMAAGLIVLLVVSGLALLCDRANDALMTTGATLLLAISWRLTAMNTWAPHIARDLVAVARRIERPLLPSLAAPADEPNGQPVPVPAAAEHTAVAEAEDERAAGDQPSPLARLTAALASPQFNAWLTLTVSGALLLIAAFTLPMFSVSFGEFGSASATLEDLARLLEANEDGISRGTEIAWQFGWGTIAFAALATAVGLVGWLNLARLPSSVLAIILFAGPLLFVIQLVGVILLTVEAEAGSGLIVGTSGFWLNLIAFVTIGGSLWALRVRSSG